MSYHNLFDRLLSAGVVIQTCGSSVASLMTVWGVLNSTKQTTNWSLSVQSAYWLSHYELVWPATDPHWSIVCLSAHLLAVFVHCSVVLRFSGFRAKIPKKLCIPACIECLMKPAHDSNEVCETMCCTLDFDLCVICVIPWPEGRCTNMSDLSNTWVTHTPCVSLLTLCYDSY